MSNISGFGYNKNYRDAINHNLTELNTKREKAATTIGDAMTTIEQDYLLIASAVGADKGLDDNATIKLSDGTVYKGKDINTGLLTKYELKYKRSATTMEAFRSIMNNMFQVMLQAARSLNLR